ncbi:MAG: epoxyqueuosine reductase [Candidatus Lokiarchaeota archaeon]|nr:epoxyqueuosine reductase [Candidatus Lokiarchaeota archaeon]
MKGSLTANLLNFSKNLGIDVIGFADVKFFNRFSEENQPNYFLRGSKAVIIIGLYLYDITLEAWCEDKNTGKNFHYLDSILENYCSKIKYYLIKNNYKAEVISYNPGFFLKDAAVLAGIGPIGKNNLLITEEFGSQVRLRALTTTAPLETNHPITENKYCKGCNICIKSCPVGALTDRKYKKNLCLSYNLANSRKLTKYTSIWCNICIEVCPISRKAVQFNIQDNLA